MMPTSITAPHPAPLHPRPPADLLALVVTAIARHLARHPHPSTFRLNLDVELMFGPITGSWLGTFEHTYTLRDIESEAA